MYQMISSWYDTLHIRYVTRIEAQQKDKAKRVRVCHQYFHYEPNRYS